MEALGIEVTHVYGLTEVYGPATVCAWQEEWAALDVEARSRKLARQGVPYPVLEGLEVMDPATMTPVPRDGDDDRRDHDARPRRHEGLPQEPTATEAAFAGGWFHTGDLAVMHADGYVEIKDRSKDIIISGGENISSIEIEGALYRHPAVLEAAVVARPDAQWGESPCAFVTLREGASATAEELIEHCRHELARFKAPRTIVFGPLPKTSTGKIQKFQLREQARQPLAVRAASGLRLQRVDPPAGIGLGQAGVERLAGLLAERLQVGGLRAGHRLVAGRPVLDRLLGVRAGLGVELRVGRWMCSRFDLRFACSYNVLGDCRFHGDPGPRPARDRRPCCDGKSGRGKAWPRCCW